ncbi:MAG: hypothetical protein V7L25_34910 [Nostoc sp.]|uniref:hypothetical protein n=1 Tax=Nostoc sp. TaxID=1180 RepID=UPI002FEEC4FC
MYEEVGESLRQAIVLANLGHTQKVVVIDTKKPLGNQRFFTVNLMFLAVFRRSLV